MNTRKLQVILDKSVINFIKNDFYIDIKKFFDK